LDTLVGGMLIKGISGGEKKRTSIAYELISDPPVIMLDEPTSGLDSLTSYVIVKHLSDLARDRNKTVIMTIHQPNSEIFGLFHKLVLMVEGRLIYQGPASQAVDYFGSQFGLVCPDFYNPADYFMSIMHSHLQQNVDRYSQYCSTYDNQFGKSIQTDI
jgi:ABC-type multidrug transport system ATPase subunit